MQPHVVIATGVYPPEIGGPATFTVAFEQGLKQYGISYTIIPFSGVRKFPKIVRHLAYFFKVLQAVQSCSIVLALDPVSVGLPALFAARVRRTPFYLRAGGDYAWEQAVARWGFEGLPEEFPGNTALPLPAKVLVWSEKFVARRAVRILTQSGHLASIVARWGVPKERIAIIPNGVALPQLPARDEARKQFGFGDEAIIVSAGRFVPWKGFAAVITAFAAVRKETPRARLILAGDGPERRELEEQSGLLGVQFPGVLSKEKLFLLLRAADIFILNTRYEGFSHQILEAMAIGTPVVTTDIPGNAELAKDGTTALVVPWNDEEKIESATRKLLEDKALSVRLAEGARMHAKQFTPERTFTETCKALGIDL